MSNANAIKKAKELGAEAFAAGKTCIPGADCLAMLKGLPMGSNEGLAILTAWNKGWTIANLQAPVPGWTDEQNAAMCEAQEKSGLFS